jgi:hypothetical protein
MYENNRIATLSAEELTSLSVLTGKKRSRELLKARAVAMLKSVCEYLKQGPWPC